MNNKMSELSLKEKACKSLLANVLDMDDDLRYKSLICFPFQTPPVENLAPLKKSEDVEVLQIIPFAQTVI